MMAECLADEREFGIVWAGDEGVRPVGCAMEITEVLERMEDGRMNLLTRGTRPFRVVEETHDAALPVRPPSSSSTTRTRRPTPPTTEAAREAYATLVEQATDKVLDDDDLDAMTAYGMAATVDFGLEAKQGLLDLRSENARLRLVTRLFRAATKRLDFIERAQARAQSNGKVRFG